LRNQRGGKREEEGEGCTFHVRRGG
jgi:hypothetical protein